jgi:hypothetical protein
MQTFVLRLYRVRSSGLSTVKQRNECYDQFVGTLRPVMSPVAGTKTKSGWTLLP